jgi:glycosyltransferase involved in cell wall biosynthesis
MFINFCLRHHKDFGGTYTAQVLFSRAIESYFVDLQIPGYISSSEADYTIPGSINPFTAYLKSGSHKFFQFIPKSIRNKTQGVIAHGLFLAQFSYALQLSKHLQVPLYIVPHGGSDPYVFSYGKLKKNLWLNILGKYASRHAKKFIFSTELERTKSVFPDAVMKGVVCPFSVEVPDNINRDSCKIWLRQKFRLVESTKILIYFSKLDHYKRPLETIRAFIKVRPNGWKLLVIGYSDKPDVQKQVQAYANDPDVIISPPIFDQKKWWYLAGSDLFVLFSNRENFSFCAVESAAMGLPIYISRGVDIYPFFSRNNEFLVFDIETQFDIELIFRSLSSLSLEELDNLGNYCHQVVINNFTFEKFKENLCAELILG